MLPMYRWSRATRPIAAATWYSTTARNFNLNVAMAGKITVVEVEHLVEVGEIDPDQMHTPGIFVYRIVVNATPEKRIEQRTVRTV